jgi:hypothetical protein
MEGQNEGGEEKMRKDRRRKMGAQPSREPTLN